jgi:hypothetical protein
MAATELLVLIVILLAGWYWFTAMRAKERAVRAGRKRCGDVGVVFLDDTVVLTKLRLRRDHHGRMVFHRQYRFEFASDGSDRYVGELTMVGKYIKTLDMEAYRVPEEDNPGTF